MNSSNDSRNSTDLILPILVGKACLYSVNFVFITTVSTLIIKTVWESSRMKKEVRYLLLCHHLLCSSLFCCLGMVYNIIRSLAKEDRWFEYWTIFGMQIAIGEAVLITLTLMAINRCIAVCWPLRYLSLVNSVKHKVLASVWIVITVQSTCLVISEYKQKHPEDHFKAEPSCPIFLGGKYARASGIVLTLVLGAIIIISYFLLYREGKQAGHFNSSNCKARKTIVIHGLQMSLHIVPSLLLLTVARDHFILKFVAFVFFSFAQCISPVVYGLRNKELWDKLFNKPKVHSYADCITNNNDNIHQLQNEENMTDSKTTDPRHLLKGHA